MQTTSTSPGPMAYQEGGIMSARTIRNTDDLIVDVPVDEIEIVDGPRLRRSSEIMLKLVHEQYVKQLFTLKTRASDSPFQRELTLASIYDFTDGGIFQFTALFCNKIVSGVYNTRTRKGWFNLD